MESRIQRIFLARIIIAATLTLTTSLATAQNDGTDPEEKTVLDAVIEPDLDRREIKESRIDSENFSIGIFSGVMSVEDFGSNNVFGARAAYHISEDWFIEATRGETTIGETTAESLFGIDIIGNDRDLEYYNVSLGVNLFPGEIYLGRNYAFNSNVFLILGAGNTSFAGDEFFTYNFGGGFRLFITDMLAFRLDFRNHIFTHSVLGEEKSIQNLETHFGLSLYF
ncbi:MAG: outer membrane beta-barrel domain-containing protein [Agarilytica sp.]